MSTATLNTDSPLILGMMRLLDYPDLSRPSALAGWITDRLDEGLNRFDHADIYGGGECERRFGAALAASPGLRQRVEIITKAGIVLQENDASRWHTKHYRAEADYLTNAIDAALARLRIERIDTFLIHRPDPLMHADELMPALERGVASGKIRQFGVSNFLPEQWRRLQQQSHLPLACNQSELSLGHTAPLFDGTLDAHLADELPWLAWSPLAGGRIGALIPEHIARQAREETGLDPTGLAMAWLRQLPGAPVPVIGSLAPDRIRSALTGASTRLPRPLWYALLEAARGQPVA